MLKLNPILLSVVILLTILPGCSLQTAPMPDANSVNTAVAQMIIVALTETAFAGTAPPTAIFTSGLPTLTPTASLSPTPIYTFTPLIPQISVSVPTNCRIGPGRVYDRAGGLLVGEVSEVYGRDPTGNYWYIRNPDQVNGFCWLWGEYATLTGNTAILPVYTPPPTPTPTPSPDFGAWYSGKDICSGWWVEIGLENTGGISFRSISLTVKDTVTDTVLSMETDGFTNIDGCLSSNTKDNLNPGATRIVSAPPFAYDPTGHKIRATITLCSERDQEGTCTSDVITFTP
jgi:hypothetical protein